MSKGMTWLDIFNKKNNVKILTICFGRVEIMAR